MVEGTPAETQYFIYFSEFIYLSVIMGKVCNICGHMGFSNALLECSECSVVYAHQYCLGIPPGTIDDTFDWFCEYCSVPIENESSQKFEGRNEVVALPEELEPLCALPPIRYHEYSTIEEAGNLSRKQVPMSSFMEHPDSIMRGTVLLVSPLGEVFIYKEEPMSSFMGHPDSIMRGIVQLGSPSGAVFIGNGEDNRNTKGSLDTSMHDKITADMSSKGKKAPLPEKGSPVKRKCSDTFGSFTAEKNSIRNQIVDMLLRAGWTVEYRPRNGRHYSDAVYVNREGKTHWSITKAYSALQKEAEGGKTGDPNFKFTPLPEEVLSKLFRDVSKTSLDRINKQTNQQRTSRIP